MTNQLDMFTSDPTPETRADWVEERHHGTDTGYRYGCRCPDCKHAHAQISLAHSKGQRTCKHCGTHYPRTTGGGTKFCKDCIADGVYQRHTARPDPRECARCRTEYRPARNERNPWKLCPTCASHPVFRVMMGPLGKHHAPTDLVLAVMDWPYCANEQCGAWLLNRAHHKRTDKASSRYTYNYAIDHDHNCCPGERSCGLCIRGIICRQCNHAMPHGLDPIKAQGIADYLNAHARRD